MLTKPVESLTCFGKKSSFRVLGLKKTSVKASSPVANESGGWREHPSA